MIQNCHIYICKIYIVADNKKHKQVLLECNFDNHCIEEIKLEKVKRKVKKYYE